VVPPPLPIATEERKRGRENIMETSSRRRQRSDDEEAASTHLRMHEEEKMKYEAATADLKAQDVHLFLPPHTRSMMASSPPCCRLIGPTTSA
jgi:hypothetical protein